MYYPAGGWVIVALAILAILPLVNIALSIWHAWLKRDPLVCLLTIGFAILWFVFAFSIVGIGGRPHALEVGLAGYLLQTTVLVVLIVLVKRRRE